MKKLILALLVAAAGFNSVQADPVKIAITGRVISSPCTVNNDSASLNISLGNTIQANTLTTAGAGTKPSDFSLSLTDCPVGTNNVKVTFTGTAAAAPQANMYLNEGTATSLAIELSEQGTGKILDNASSLTQPVQADKTVTYALSARAVTATGNVMPGFVVAAIQADFSYN